MNYESQKIAKIKSNPLKILENPLKMNYKSQKNRIKFLKVPENPENS